MMRRTAQGFTLIEAMITVVIIGILAAVALPNYREYVVRSRLVDGTGALAAGRARMEQYFQDNRTYASVTRDGASLPIKPPCLTSQSISGWTVGCAAAPGDTSYVIIATGSGITAGFVFAIDESGAQTTTALPAGWGTVPAGGSLACWLTRKGGSC